MQETCAVALRVELPRAIARELEVVQRQDPELLVRIFRMGLSRFAPPPDGAAGGAAPGQSDPSA
jgi:hypothetical protein